MAGRAAPPSSTGKGQFLARCGSSGTSSSSSSSPVAVLSSSPHTTIYQRISSPPCSWSRSFSSQPVLFLALASLLVLLLLLRPSLYTSSLLTAAMGLSAPAHRAMRSSYAAVGGFFERTFAPAGLKRIQHQLLTNLKADVEG